MEWVLLGLACLFGFFMAWGVGANDVANAMGTSVGSKALTLKQAIIVAAIFEALGALLAGSQVTDTIRSKIISPELFQATPELLIYGMLAALLAAGVWLAIATFWGLPVSTTHTIVGAILGFGLIEFGPEAVNWSVVTNIVLSWVITPLLSGIVAYGVFSCVQVGIFSKTNMVKYAKRWIPFYIFLTGFVVSFITLTKGLKHLKLGISIEGQLGLAIAFSLLMTLIGQLLVEKVQINHENQLQSIEKLFARLMIFTACAMAFAHGSNDVANAIGPLAAVVDMLHASRQVVSSNAIPLWILTLGAGGIVFGLVTYGYRVIATIGEKITELTPSRGFAVEIATASTVVIASGIGLPVSTTQTLVGAVLGVGVARGIGAIRLSVVRNIVASWLVTLPAGAVLAAFFYQVFVLLFSYP